VKSEHSCENSKHVVAQKSLILVIPTPNAAEESAILRLGSRPQERPFR
jgi:hypothetical protein